MRTKKQATERVRTGPLSAPNLAKRAVSYLFVSSLVLWLSACFPVQALAQPAASSKTVGHSTPIDKAIELAASGQCEKALPTLKKLAPAITDSQLKYKALTSIVRCGMNQREDQTTADALLTLEREYPDNLDVLYMSTQYFLEIALRASQHLNAIAPNSYQARELQADTSESQGKWEEAIAVYRQILADNPKLRGIHYRLGHCFLALRDSPTSLDDAKKEFQAEIAIDPVNAASQYWLGEIARRQAQWDDSIAYYQAAIKTEPQFAEAYLGLGTTYNSAGRYADAIAPLQRYIQLLPDNPAGHYQLSLSYTRVGRSQDAEQERTVLREITARAQAKAATEAPAPPQ